MNTPQENPHLWQALGCLVLITSTAITATIIGAAIFTLTR